MLAANTMTRQEISDFFWMKRRVDSAADRRTDTGTPDSLGDELVRLSLKMFMAILKDKSFIVSNDGDSPASTLMREASILLTRHEEDQLLAKG